MKKHYYHSNIKRRFAQAAAVGILIGSLTIGLIRPGAEAVDGGFDATFEGDTPVAVGALVIHATAAEPEPEPRLFTDAEIYAMKIARWEAMKEARKEQPEPETEPKMTYLGNWRITGYDTCARCCGKTDGITASGEKAVVGVTCAGPKSLPFGTRIWIDGIGERVVQDRGGAINGQHIDVLCSDHAECFSITGWYDVWEVIE